MDFGQILGVLGNAMGQSGGDTGKANFGFSGMRQPEQRNPYGLEEEEQRPQSILDLLMRYDQDPRERMFATKDANANWLTKFGGY